MKKYLPLIILMFVCLTKINSQNKVIINKNSTSIIKPIFQYEKPTSLTQKIGYSASSNNFADSKYDLSLLLSKKNTFTQQDTSGANTILNSRNKMPCFNPKGSFPMVVSEPDSTCDYSLLIKRIK
ncbi:hypothetical protein [Carboxylicivirga sp. N1Y90]|uniref:hypothetical protein n=1 Tax=Carboxylicivirga fragile TaxID=3417571 RepID=UPI003D34DF5D|nr:hypothetical protein [Marinilabiliaceae bacterium N1Y90]